MMTQKSFWLTKEAGEAQREWYVVDATGQTLGRLASQIAMVLRGKHKATYTPNVDMGDFVIVLNAGSVRADRHQARQEAVPATTRCTRAASRRASRRKSSRTIPSARSARPCGA